MRKLLCSGLTALLLACCCVTFSSFARAQEKGDGENVEVPVESQEPAKKPVEKKKSQKAQKAQKAPKGTVKTIGSWQVTCGPQTGLPGNCSARLQMIDPKQKAPILTWFIGFGEKGTPLMEVVTPSGVMISPGVKMEIGKSKSKAPYVSCVPAGCASRFIADKPVLDALRTNKQMRFTIVTITKQIANVNVKPVGTAEMLAAIGL